MTKRLIDKLRALAKELIETGYDAQDLLEGMNFSDINILAVREELSTPEVAQHIDEAELDSIRAFLAYLLMKDSELETEEIYSFIFGKGKQIVWH